MTRTYEAPNRYAALIALFCISSLVLVLATVYIIQALSISYGSGAESSSATQVLMEHSLYTMILYGYVDLIVALGMLLSAALLYKYNTDMLSPEAIGHVNLNGALTMVYVLLFALYLNSVQVSLPAYYTWIVSGAMAICLLIDLYIMMFVRYIIPKHFTEKRTESLILDPFMPYTNLMRIKDNVFSRLKGHVCLVDKHMNSIGLENLYRLISDSMGHIHHISELNIITSKEMLDKDFSKNYNDLSNEVKRAGVKMKIMIMDDSDSAMQHERFIFDGSYAYKVPPLNIIHKKSEHIIRINIREAKKRFEQLYSHSMKYENFIIKMGQNQEGNTAHA